MLIDDHTRFKFVYFLKNKSEAAKKAAEFVAQFNHAASSKSITARACGWSFAHGQRW